MAPRPRLRKTPPSPHVQDSSPDLQPGDHSRSSPRQCSDTPHTSDEDFDINAVDGDDSEHNSDDFEHENDPPARTTGCMQNVVTEIKINDPSEFDRGSLRGSEEEEETKNVYVNFFGKKDKAVARRKCKQCE